MTDRNLDVRWAVGTPTGPGPLKVLCPWHDDFNPSMAVYPNGTWCFTCQRGEGAEEFLRRVEHDGAGLPDRSKVERQAGYRGARRPNESRTGSGLLLDRPALYVPIWHALLLDGPRQPRVPWLLDRALMLDTLRREQLGHTGEQFVIPVWNYAHTRVLGYKLRQDPLYADPDDPAKYVMPRGQDILIYRPNLRGRPTVICEGELDALVLAQYGIDAVTTTGGAGSLDRHLNPEVLRDPDILSAVDLDEEGDRAHAKLCTRFGRDLPRLRWEGGKDISDALRGVHLIERSTYVRALIRQATS